MRRQREAVGILGIPIGQLGVGGLFHAGQIGRKEVHLLGKPSLDDLVVLVEAKHDRLS